MRDPRPFSAIAIWRDGRISLVVLISRDLSRTILTIGVPAMLRIGYSGLVDRVLRRDLFFGAFQIFLQEPHHLETMKVRKRLQRLAQLSHGLAGYCRLVRQPWLSYAHSGNCHGYRKPLDKPL